MTTLFQKIINGELPAAKIYEDDKYLAFLDIFPLTPGHTLVIPKEPEPYLFDLDDETYQGLMALSKKLAVHLKEKMECERVCVAVLGWEVPHTHVHLIPTNSIGDFPFVGPLRKKAEPEDLQAMCAKLEYPK